MGPTLGVWRVFFISATPLCNPAVEVARLVAGLWRYGVGAAG